MRANEFITESELDEARRNNFGREISNAQGQALGKKLAAGDPNAQQALAQAKAAQATNQTDNTGGVLGKTTPQQRLAAKRAQAAGPAIDADEIKTPTAANSAAAGNSVQQPSTTDKLKGAASKAGDMASGAADAIGNAYDKVAGGVDRFSQSRLGQKLGGWSQRLIGVGNKTAAAQQYWMKNYLSMVNNLVANSKRSGVPLDLADSMDDYIVKQKIKIDPAKRQAIKNFAAKVQQGGFQRQDVVKLGNSIWAIGLNAPKTSYYDQNKALPAAAAGASAEQPAQQPTSPLAEPAKQTSVSPLAEPTQQQGATAQQAQQAQPGTSLATTKSNMPATQQQYGSVNQGPVRWHTSQQLKGPENRAAGQVGMDDPNVIDVDAREVPDTKQLGMKPRQLGMTQPATKQAQGTTPVGTKFALKVRGQLVKAEKTADGWKVQGKLINDPKQAAVLDKQAKLATQNKGRPVNRANPARQPKPGIQPNRPAKPVRKLKTPSALAKGTPGKPAQAGKPRIRK